MPETAKNFNHNQPITRRVRLDLPSTLPPVFKAMFDKRPYQEWLKVHIAEVMALKIHNGEALLLAIHSRWGKTENGLVFVTDFHFRSQAEMEYYNQHFLAKMRSRIEESYPGAISSGSPFAYRIALDTDKTVFEGLLNGITNFQTIV